VTVAFPPPPRRKHYKFRREFRNLRWVGGSLGLVGGGRLTIGAYLSVSYARPFSVTYSVTNGRASYSLAIVQQRLADFDGETRGLVETIPFGVHRRTGIRVEGDVGPRRRLQGTRFRRRPTRARVCEQNKNALGCIYIYIYVCVCY